MGKRVSRTFPINRKRPGDDDDVEDNEPGNTTRSCSCCIGRMAADKGV